MKCYFDSGYDCNVLIERRCGKCKFRKSEQEFKQGLKDTQRRLCNMGLRKVMKRRDDGKFIITTEPGFDEEVIE